jgi:uncharacterized protein (DUF983 family)
MTLGHDIVHVVPARPTFRSMLRGALGRCPACGGRTLFSGYLTVSEACSVCDEQFSHHRADDAPPYFTMLIVGHVVVGLVLWAEIAYSPPLWLHLAIAGPLTLGLSLALLRPIKGAIVGLQWAQRMHGFGDEGDDLHDGGLKPDRDA